MASKTDKFITVRIYRPEYNDLETIKRRLASDRGAPMSFALVIRELVKYYNLGHQKAKQ